MSSSLTDQQLRQRLGEYNFSVPPINENTRRVLIRKLAEFEKQDIKKSSSSARRATRGNAKSSNLIDYSSAEEEATGCKNSERPVRRISRSNRNSRSSTPIQGQKNKQLQLDKLSNGFQPSARRTRSANTLMSYSENEEEEEEDDDESVEDEENVHEDDYDVDEDGSEDDDDDDEDLDEPSKKVNFAGQTSPSLDSPSYHSPQGINNGGLHFRGSNKYVSKDNSTPSSSPSSGRFACSTPLNPVLSTSLYMKNAGLNSSSYNITSPQLRAMANSKEFGSLGEVLSSMSSTPTSVGQRQHNGSLQNSSPVTQVSNTSQNRSNNTTSSTRNSASFSYQESKLSVIFSSAMISKMIIALATFFFLCLFLKYASLRPTPDLQTRIPICGVPAEEHICVEAQDKEKIITLFKEIVHIMDKHSIQSTCESNDTNKMAYDIVVNKLQELHKDENLKEVLLTLTQLMMENPAWGITLLDHNESEVKELAHVTFISLAHPALNWKCWLMQKGQELTILTIGIGMYVTYVALLGIVVYGSYKLYVWWREKKLQEKQEIYEMVEKVLSLLVAQHQAMSREPRPGVRPGVAVNHIRDELISPADRKKKQKLWNQVVKYIKDSDSRVREDVQRIYGEEHRVWQWLPEFHWSPLTHPERPHPYTPNFIRPPPPISSPPSVMVSSPGSPHWQGPAFNSLNKNVASPTIAPTNCLKVRHLFDSQRMKVMGWAWQVKQDVLKRCVYNAKILHIAIDTESTEGCVYIKALTTEDALNVFKTLHGQWYKGNLVTVKYLREERYFERFPDAKFLKIPLKPST